MCSPRKETPPRAVNTETDHLELGSEGGHESAICEPQESRESVDVDVHVEEDVDVAADVDVQAGLGVGAGVVQMLCPCTCTCTSI